MKVNRSILDQVANFLIESNAIEGIYRPPLQAELRATVDFLSVTDLSLADVLNVQKVYAPDMPLRDHFGMDVRVGKYVAPKGSPRIKGRLLGILADVMNKSLTPWKAHVEFEKLHPFMDGNGRTGRTLWAWSMIYNGRDPFALDFLHQFYYDTLANYDNVKTYF